MGSIGLWVRSHYAMDHVRWPEETPFSKAVGTEPDRLIVQRALVLY
jgi:hypothetical protein